ncbi:MAG: hypothetical protein HY326_03305 [Chloroflexi bacterium]|nr:hypothetical protein [Chloroflexota bacterium]
MAAKPQSRKAFLNGISQQVATLLPDGLQELHTQNYGRMLQLYYDDPALHFEIWPVDKTGRLEVGLHFESNRATNEWLYQELAAQIFEIKSELGHLVEVERWDHGWSRVHETLSLQPFDEGFQRDVTERLARYIAILWPMVQQALSQPNAALDSPSASA